MRDFTMTKYWNQYQEGVTRLGHLKGRIEGMRAGLPYAEDVDAATADIDAAEAECKALEAEVDDLWCLAHTGKHRKELGAVHFKTPYGGFAGHWPG